MDELYTFLKARWFSHTEIYNLCTTLEFGEAFFLRWADSIISKLSLFSFLTSSVFFFFSLKESFLSNLPGQLTVKKKKKKKEKNYFLVNKS